MIPVVVGPDRGCPVCAGRRPGWVQAHAPTTTFELWTGWVLLPCPVCNCGDLQKLVDEVKGDGT